MFYPPWPDYRGFKIPSFASRGHSYICAPSPTFSFSSTWKKNSFFLSFLRALLASSGGGGHVSLRHPPWVRHWGRHQGNRIASPISTFVYWQEKQNNFIDFKVHLIHIFFITQFYFMLWRRVYWWPWKCPESSRYTGVFSSPEPKAHNVSLQDWTHPGVRPLQRYYVRSSVRVSRISNMNISETSWPIAIKFYLKHYWGGGRLHKVLGQIGSELWFPWQQIYLP